MGLPITAMSPVNFSAATAGEADAQRRCAWEVNIGNADVCIGEDNAQDTAATKVQHSLTHTTSTPLIVTLFHKPAQVHERAFLT